VKHQNRDMGIFERRFTIGTEGDYRAKAACRGEIQSEYRASVFANEHGVGKNVEAAMALYEISGGANIRGPSVVDGKPGPAGFFEHFQNLIDMRAPIT